MGSNETWVFSFFLMNFEANQGSSWSWGYSSLVLVRTWCWEFENGSIHVYMNFRRKSDPLMYYPIGPILDQNYPCFTIFQKNWANFGKFWKMDLLRYQILHRKGIWYTRRHFATIFAACLYRGFCTEYPPSPLCYLVWVYRGFQLFLCHLVQIEISS